MFCIIIIRIQILFDELLIFNVKHLILLVLLYHYSQVL